MHQQSGGWMGVRAWMVEDGGWQFALGVLFPRSRGLMVNGEWFSTLQYSVESAALQLILRFSLHIAYLPEE